MAAVAIRLVVRVGVLIFAYRRELLDQVLFLIKVDLLGHIQESQHIDLRVILQKLFVVL